MNLSIIQSFLTNTLLFNGISITVALVSIILAAIFYFRAQKLRLPTYAIRNFNLIKEKIEKISGLKISYQEQSINNLSIAKIILWNRGKETIRKEDIASKDPLRLVAVSNNDILEAKIIYQKNKANNFSIVPTSNKRKLLINFDYFDQDEGVILQLFHTGKSRGDIEIQGVIKGADSIKKIGDPFMFKITRPMNFLDKVKGKHKRLILGVLCLIMPVLLIIGDFLPKYEIKNIVFKYSLFLLVLFFYWSTAYSILHKRMPRGFELFEDEETGLIK